MTKINKTAENLLEELHQADLAYRNAEIVEERRAQREKAERILSIKLNRDKIAARLRLEEKVSWEKISNAMGVKGASRARQAVADGRRLLGDGKPEVIVDGEKFEWDAESGTLTVTLAVDDVLPILEYTPYAPEEVDGDLLVGRFVRNEFGWTDDPANSVGSPVSTLFFSPTHGSLLAEAEAFIAS